MRKNGSPLLVIAGLLLAASTHAENPDPFVEWPDGWRSAYARFHDFADAQRRLWPRSEAEILPDGSIHHGIPITETTTEHITTEFFHNGVSILSSGGTDGILDDSLARFFQPGRYTLAIKTSGSLDYQYAFPIDRFEIADDRRSVRKAAEDPSEAVWPNERILSFFNFHVLPHRNPNDIREVNAKVSPTLRLDLTNSSEVRRELLTDQAERQLVWRIYHQGALIEDGPAGGVLAKQMTGGPGTYQVLLGIDGPDGFMPVSNFLEFPLFPSAEGSLVVRPEPSEENGGVPSFLVGVARVGANEFSRADADGDGLTNAEEGYAPLVATAPEPDDPEKAALLRLWSAWSWEIANRIRDDPERPSLIQLQ